MSSESESPQKKARTEKTSRKRKSRSGPNLWGAEQKKCAWHLFHEGIISPESIPPKKELIDICSKHKEFKNFLGKRYPQLRVHFNDLASKYVLYQEKRVHEGNKLVSLIKCLI